ARGVQKIRNTQITADEFNILLNSGQRLCQSTLDAVCAAIQASAEDLGTSPSWVVFSSWLISLVKEMVKKGLYTGTFEQHLKLVV
ncbi:hypothetical protein BJ165DRAFT_1358675, partial [Panaeolus papilionaceus]